MAPQGPEGDLGPSISFPRPVFGQGWRYARTTDFRRSSLPNWCPHFPISWACKPNPSTTHHTSDFRANFFRLYSSSAPLCPFYRLSQPRLGKLPSFSRHPTCRNAVLQAGDQSPPNLEPMPSKASRPAYFSNWLRSLNCFLLV